jgi:hypothetical protein
MRLIALLFLILNTAFAEMITVEVGKKIENSHMRHNFSELSSTAQDNHLKIEFNTYSSDELIQSSKMNEDIIQLNNFFLEGDNNTDNLPLINPNTPIYASEINSLFTNAKAFILNSIGQSCLNIKERNPDITDDGFYQIKPQGLSESFWVYCDMVNGGWTLLFERNMDNNSGFSPSNVVYIGDSSRSDNINLFTQELSGLTINYSDLQKAVKHVKGTYIRFPGNYVAKSSQESSFREKLINRTPWSLNITDAEISPASGDWYACDGNTVRGQVISPTRNRIIYPAWDFSFSGTNTFVSALAGCWGEESYGDRMVFGVSIYAERRNTSCGVDTGGSDPCNIYYITGRAAHRSNVILSRKDWSTWIK